MTDTASASSRRDLPSIDRLVAEHVFRKLEERFGRETSLRIARESVAAVRSELSVGSDESAPLDRILFLADRAYEKELRRGTLRVINATGVVVHTNLGRSSLSEEAMKNVVRNSGRYCALEFDIESGKRGKRGERAESMICQLTGAEAAAIVNNCAAAAFLVLRVLAAGKEVIISRGELVEIGGDFRIPDVLTESGAVLREVGTTNRTKLRDYERAIGENTGMMLRVHPSNFRVIGFTESPTNLELASLASEYRVPFVEDAGSGLLTDLSSYGLAGEPLIARSIEDGADLVLFSGDKLMGGVQAGFIIGREDLVAQIRKHPLFRALRVDKLTYAAIEATLHSYLRGTELTELPTLRMISAARDEVERRSLALVEALRNKIGDRLNLEVIEGESVIGGGSAPDVRPATSLVSIRKESESTEYLAMLLRLGPNPVIARVENERLLLDLRTVFPDEEAELVQAIVALAA